MQKNALPFLFWVLYILILSLIWYFRLGSVMLVLLAVIGSLIGFLLPVVLDVLLPRMIDGSATADTAFAKDILKESADQIRQGNTHVKDVPKTPLRSYPLLLAYAAATIFVITSTQNWFGRGFVMGLGFSLVLDIFFSRNPDLLRDRWFSVFKTNLTNEELHYFVWIVLGTFGLLSLFAAFV